MGQQGATWYGTSKEKEMENCGGNLESYYVYIDAIFALYGYEDFLLFFPFNPIFTA